MEFYGLGLVNKAKSKGTVKTEGNLDYSNTILERNAYSLNTKSHRHLVEDYTSLRTLGDNRLSKEINSYINPSKIFSLEGKYTVTQDNTNHQTYKNTRQRLHAKDKDSRYIYNTRLSIPEFISKKSLNEVNTLTRSADYGEIKPADPYLYKNHHGENIKLPKFYDRIRHV